MRGRRRTNSSKRIQKNQTDTSNILVMEPQTRMSVRASILRLCLVSLLLGTLTICSKLGLHDNPAREDHPVSLFFITLNGVFKRFGWLVSAATWSLVLLARYFRQATLHENASWRRHAVVDITLWILASVYWFINLFLFSKVGDKVGACIIGQLHKIDLDSRTCKENKGRWVPFDISGHTFLCSLAICLLMEEVIRFIGEPMFYFTNRAGGFYNFSKTKVRSCKLIWWMAVSLASLVSILWLILFVRTSLFYHSFQEKLWGCLLGMTYWWGVVFVRLVLLYCVCISKNYNSI